MSLALLAARKGAEKEAIEHLFGAAAEGLVRTEAEARHMDLAASAYRKFRGDHGGNPALLDEVRDRLGELALRAGGLPDFRAAALDGDAVDRNALLGKVVIVDFWAAWCRPCVEGLAELKHLVERFGDEIAVVGVSLDRADDLSASDLRDWMAREKVPGRQICDGRGWDSEIVRALGTTAIPLLAVSGRDGTVLAINEHGRSLEKTLRMAVEQ